MRYNILHGWKGGMMALIIVLPPVEVEVTTNPGRKSPVRQVSYEQYAANWALAFGKNPKDVEVSQAPDPQGRPN